MRRLYCMTPGKAIPRTIVDERLLARIDARHLPVLAKQGTRLEGMPEASSLQTPERIAALELGLTLGGGTGLPSRG